ncbi:MAG TPA: esterase-like activity of phytase family protein [Roseiflexaceae bacterium]|nr:esterase-like activity of phytase family protein [Roseiflexaceae bacterium]
MRKRPPWRAASSRSATHVVRTSQAQLIKSLQAGYLAITPSGYCHAVHFLSSITLPEGEQLMSRRWRTTLAVLMLIMSSVWVVSWPSRTQAATPGITLIGKGLVNGSGLDTSGLAGNICQAGVPTNCVPKAIFGGFGSDITYTGYDDVFLAAPDRGPFDGLTDVPYLDRFYFLHITTDVGAPFPNIRTRLLDTRFFQNERGQTFVGAAGAFDINSDSGTLRLDPEGIRVGKHGTFYVSDEYGPYVLEFNRQGHLVRRIAVPSTFAITTPSADPNAELLGNTSGRQANRGMEGLAISPDGRYLFGIMQNALLQDNGLSAGTTNRLGLNNRILKIDLKTGQTHEYVYVLDAINRGQGVSEILAINDHEFLVVERDNRSNLQSPPQAPTRKTLYKIDLAGATDVSNIANLPAGALPAGVVPAAKALFIDLLDPAFNLAPTIAEKIEGLAWGPDLADGRHVLYVISDNDLNPELATQIYAFAIDASLIDYEEQNYSGPLYPPGQVKKALG